MKHEDIESNKCTLNNCTYKFNAKIGTLTFNKNYLYLDAVFIF